jgi:long-chain acyl-CoA synthetase
MLKYRKNKIKHYKWTTEYLRGFIVRKYPLYAVERILDLKQLTDRSVRLYEKKEAFKMMTGKSESISVTYGQFGEDLCALSNALISLGFAGRRIALIGENSYQWVLSYFAIVNSNITAVPLDKELTREEILSLIKRSGATVFIYSDTYKPEALCVVKEIPDIYTVSFGTQGNGKRTLQQLIELGREIVEKGENKYTDIEIDREKTCSILYTSGTTGISKGVMLTHKSLAANIVAACQTILYKPEDTMLSVLPIHHSYEDMGGIFSPILRGCTIAFCPSVKQLTACFAEFKPTIMVLVPLYLETFYKRIWDGAKKHGKERTLKIGIFLANLLGAMGIDIRNSLFREVYEPFGGRLKLIISGGAHLDPKLVKNFRSLGIKVLQGYGTTECSPIIAANRNECHKDASVGLVLPCCIVDFDEDGQILVRGENVMTGYLDDKEATEQSFRDGWYKTGDLGFMDKYGFLYVTGRCKDLIVLKNGKNISPEEIEELLQKSPLIAEAMVKESPGDENGSDSLMAIIYADPEISKGMSEEELRRAVKAEIDRMNQKLVFYKRIREFILRHEEFPKTSTKKIMRYKVRQEG